MPGGAGGRICVLRGGGGRPGDGGGARRRRPWRSSSWRGWNGATADRPGDRARRARVSIYREPYRLAPRRALLRPAVQDPDASSTRAGRSACGWKIARDARHQLPGAAIEDRRRRRRRHRRGPDERASRSCCICPKRTRTSFTRWSGKSSGLSAPPAVLVGFVVIFWRGLRAAGAWATTSADIWRWA